MVASDNPVLCELWRNGALESQHRGVWVVVDGSGRVLDGRGDPDQAIFARSATKSLQALPFVETGAADAIDAGPAELALAISSHSGEPIHLAVTAGVLDRAGLDPTALRCGPQRPLHPQYADQPAQRIANNCSGKHAAFLATATHLGDDPARYLRTDSRVQRAVRSAVASMTDTEPRVLGAAIDGCSAPTFRLPVRALALGLARVANPDALDAHRAAACRRLTAAAAAHPELIGGTTGRIDTDLIAASAGRVFAKGGAEGVFAIGIAGAGLGIACKIDDGNQRGYTRFVVELLLRLGQLSDQETNPLGAWRDPVRRNWDGIDIGEHVIASGALP